MVHLSEDKGPGFKIKNDPRITKLGRFLRKTHLDELPQFFNVIRGEMSIVGPRANSYHPDHYEPWQLRRLSVKPGITGSWQHRQGEVAGLLRALPDGYRVSGTAIVPGPTCGSFWRPPGRGPEGSRRLKIVRVSR